MTKLIIVAEFDYENTTILQNAINSIVEVTTLLIEGMAKPIPVIVTSEIKEG